MRKINQELKEEVIRRHEAGERMTAIHKAMEEKVSYSYIHKIINLHKQENSMPTVTTPLPIYPPPDHIAFVMEKMRRDILADQFHITRHASERMVQRGFSHADIVEGIRCGQLSVGRRVEDWIGGLFIYKDTAFVVYTEYNKPAALPYLVTMYRNNEDVDYAVDFDKFINPKPVPAPSVRPTALSKPKPKLEVVQEVKPKALPEFTDEEIEAEYLLRLAAKTERERKVRLEKIEELRTRLGFLDAERIELTKQLEDLETML